MDGLLFDRTYVAQVGDFLHRHSGYFTQDPVGIGA